MTVKPGLLLLITTCLCTVLPGQVPDVNGDFPAPFPTSGPGMDAPPGTLLKGYPQSIQVIGTTFVGDYPWGVTLSSASVLYEFDLKDGSILQSISHGFASPYGLGYDLRRQEFVMTSASSGLVARVDVAGKVTTAFPCPTTRPIGVAYDQNRDAYWVADWNANVLHVMDATTGSTIQPSFDLRPSGCTKSADVGYDPVNDLLCIIGRNSNQAFLYDVGSAITFRGAVSWTGFSMPGGARGAAFHPRLHTLVTDCYSSPYSLYHVDIGLPRVDAAATVGVGKGLPVTWTAGSSPGLFYQGGASFTEGVIGMPFGTRYFPLLLDDLFYLSLQVPSIFNNFKGYLDSTGTAAGSVNVPNMAPLNGVIFSLAFVTTASTAPQGIQDISGPWKVTITP